MLLKNVRNREERLAVLRTIVDNKTNTTRRIGIRKALRYSGCSKNIYYCKDRRNKITTAATAVIAVTPSITTIEQDALLHNYDFR